ncbi:hypothetical protein GGG16DRAFT_125540 [Schizophyllum commune]
MNCRPAPCDDPLLAGLSPADLVRLGLVDWAARHRVQDFIKRSFHLPSTLAVFFTRSEVETLRYVMMDTGAVIVGDIVLHFLGRVSTHESVLELAVAYSATSRLGMFLNQLGFTCESSPSGNHSFASLFYEQDGFPEEWGEDGEALLCSFDFIRPSNGTNSVRILVARVCPVDYVLDLPCTAAMNFITHRSAYSLYPLDTFGRSRSLCLSVRGQSLAADALVAKLADEGFAPLRWLYEQEAGDASVSFGRCYRFVGDEHTWVLPVWPDLDCVDSDVDLAMWQSWCLRFHAYLPPTSSRSYSVVAGPVMKRRYVSGHPLDSSAPTLGCVFADSRLRGQFVRITQFMGSSLPW